MEATIVHKINNKWIFIKTSNNCPRFLPSKTATLLCTSGDQPQLTKRNSNMPQTSYSPDKICLPRKKKDSDFFLHRKRWSILKLCLGEVSFKWDIKVKERRDALNFDRNKAIQRAGILLYDWVFEPFSSCLGRSAETIPAAFWLTLSAISSSHVKMTVYTWHVGMRTCSVALERNAPHLTFFIF